MSIARSQQQRLQFSTEDLEALLEGRDSWTIFEDAEDEVRFLRHRGDILLTALRAARKEIAQLHHAGGQLQDAYEALQLQHREVAGDAAYWKALAESRKELALTPRKAFVSEEFATPREERSLKSEANQEPVSVSPASRLACVTPPPVDPREALRQAAAEAAKAEAARRKAVVDQFGERAKQSTAEPAGAKTPPRRSPSEASDCDASSVTSESFRSCGSSRSASVCSVTPKRRHNMEAELGRSLLLSPSSSTKWGPGSTPKRCPGLGTPSRRALTNATPSSLGNQEAPSAVSARHGRIADLVNLFEKRTLTTASPARPTSKAFAEAIAEALTKGPASTPLKGGFTPQRRI